ncbi:MAG TPA: thioredoxin-dependent thiol peroxidase [Verrucomicrobiae bacterium]|jgi:peroxiredoxin Q/BCP|nr:thioredoxin-dependent thiol peroxidase [Verrucomicrobiae bacterium]
MATKMVTLKEGDKAPEFSAVATGGVEMSLSDFNGKNVVLYFYPRDDTPGCTKEACGFRDHFAEIRKRGALVLGVSKDSTKSHGKFAGKFDLPFPLLSDEDHKIAEAYGVWGEKKFMGRTYMGMNRVTFLIDGDGRIKKIWRTVKPDEHAAEVLAAL